MRFVIIILAIGMATVGTCAFGQEKPDSMRQFLSRENYYGCIDYYYNATLVIPRLYDEGKIDSIYLVLDYVEKECTPSSFTRRTRILLKMEEEDFSERLYDSTILSDFMTYQEAMKSIDAYGYEKSWYTCDHPEANRKFDGFIIALAGRMSDKYPPGTVEHLLSGFYAGDFTYFFRELKGDTYAGTDLQEYYLTFFRHLEAEYGNQGGHMAALVGFWRPLGANGILGNKPELGFTVGRKCGRRQYDLTLLLRFTSAKERYVYRDKGVLDTTSHFFGGYFGIDVGHELFTAGNHQFEIVGGIGYDGFDTKNSDNDDDKGHSIGSLNLNVGFRHKLYVNRFQDFYIGLQGRYNFVKYGTDGGSDLSGNTFSLQLIIGRIADDTFRWYAKKLGYYD